MKPIIGGVFICYVKYLVNFLRRSLHKVGFILHITTLPCKAPFTLFRHALLNIIGNPVPFLKRNIFTVIFVLAIAANIYPTWEMARVIYSYHEKYTFYAGLCVEIPSMALAYLSLWAVFAVFVLYEKKR